MICRGIEDLCNGSTPDSDSVCGGSNPSSSAKNKTPPDGWCFIFAIGFWGFEPIKCNCPVDSCGSQFKNWLHPYGFPYRGNRQSNPSSLYQVWNLRLKCYPTTKRRIPMGLFFSFAFGREIWESILQNEVRHVPKSMVRQRKEIILSRLAPILSF